MRFHTCHDGNAEIRYQHIGFSTETHKLRKRAPHTQTKPCALVPSPIPAELCLNRYYKDVVTPVPICM